MLPNVASHAIDYAAANPHAAFRHAMSAGGRLAGLSGQDTGAIVQQGLPQWFWVVVGFGAGAVFGVWAASAHADKVPSWLPGRSA